MSGQTNNDHATTVVQLAKRIEYDLVQLVKLIDEVDRRCKILGRQILDAGQTFGGTTPSSDPAQLRAGDAVRDGGAVPAGALVSALAVDPAANRAGHSAGTEGGLPRALADLERYRVNRPNSGADHRGEATKQQSGRD